MKSFVMDLYILYPDGLFDRFQSDYDHTYDQFPDNGGIKWSEANDGFQHIGFGHHLFTHQINEKVTFDEVIEYLQKLKQ